MLEYHANGVGPMRAMLRSRSALLLPGRDEETIGQKSHKAISTAIIAASVASVCRHGNGMGGGADASCITTAITRCAKPLGGETACSSLKIRSSSSISQA